MSKIQVQKDRIRELLRLMTLETDALESFADSINDILGENESIELDSLSNIISDIRSLNDSIKEANEEIKR